MPCGIAENCLVTNNNAVHQEIIATQKAGAVPENQAVIATTARKGKKGLVECIAGIRKVRVAAIAYSRKAKP